jgi:hypothetical protein
MIVGIGQDQDLRFKIDDGIGVLSQQTGGLLFQEGIDGIEYGMVKLIAEVKSDVHSVAADLT